jgi:hypothetical protein
MNGQRNLPLGQSMGNGELANGDPQSTNGPLVRAQIWIVAAHGYP